MDDKLLEWVKVLGPIVFSWPVVAVLIVLFFRKPLMIILGKFAKAPEGSTLKAGPFELQIGKNIHPKLDTDKESEAAFEQIDLSKSIGEIRNQGPESTVVGFSLAYAMQASIYQKRGISVTLSPRSIYATAQKYDEWASRPHEGTSLSGAIRGMKKEGAYLESDWPYDERKKPQFIKKPSHKVSAAKRLFTIEQIEEALLGGSVVVASIKWTKDFYKPDENGRVILRGSSVTDIIGAGTVCFVGYNTKSAELKFALSWGTRWGQAGFGFIRDSDLSKILIEAYIIEAK
jgi:hypothetical protein